MARTHHHGKHGIDNRVARLMAGTSDRDRDAPTGPVKTELARSYRFEERRVLFNIVRGADADAIVHNIIRPDWS